MRDLACPLPSFRAAIAAAYLAPEDAVLDALRPCAPTQAQRAAAHTHATALVEAIRADDAPGLMEVFLAEYGLSTDEGIALMCLAEALLRVPDAETVDELIEDKIAPSEWGAHLGRSSSSLVNASTWALMLTGRVLRDDSAQGLAGVLHGAVRRLGEPVIRTAVRRAMKEMGNQFVLGETIDKAIARGKTRQAQGYTYSYDMLGEAAMTAHDAEAYTRAYADAIARLTPHCTAADIRANPGISVKLSALHPRYQTAQRDRVMSELVPRVLSLAIAAKAAGMGLNIDAEEADRLELSLDVIAAVLGDPQLAGWDGFGVVVQAYSKRAAPVIDWLHALACDLDRRIMVRLVKGAYWDTEIKRAQVGGLAGFPVFTRKAATDVSYQCCAAKLLGLTDRIYPQFATHNAQTVATILEMAGDRADFEFQRLHGMGAALHDKVMAQSGTRCRIYAPVGAHRDLLAYLVRRLLENGANSSFVNQVIDTAVPAAKVAADPFEAAALGTPNPAVCAPLALFAPERSNASGIDLAEPQELNRLLEARAQFESVTWQAGPMGAAPLAGGATETIINPANPIDTVGTVLLADPADVAAAWDAAQTWAQPAEQRAAVLNRAADLFEANAPELYALLAREAGKTLPDAQAELREAVDFLRYYAAQAQSLSAPARGNIACISPWNFPLAIFTGQVAAALAAGNAVCAKPAETTPLIAARAVTLLHSAGVPSTALQLLPGHGATVGAALVSDPRVDGVTFTGSTATAQAIHRAMADHLAPDAVLIAETGGLNAMIVDSTALPEQAVRDVLSSAFQSAGQRCSALRMLYVQDDIAPGFLKMLFGAMDELAIGQPWDVATDIGPVIDAKARDQIDAYLQAAQAEGRTLKRLGTLPSDGYFIAPSVLRVQGIADLTHEVFGPVLHVATFAADQIDAVVDAINASGYGLTFGMHSRIDSRVQAVAERVRAGNIYINRNQIGAVVGSQPFGGEGLSGTGPKAGGPHYLSRLCRHASGSGGAALGEADVQAVQSALDGLPTPLRAGSVTSLPGPTGETNRLTLHPRRAVLCLGPGPQAAQAQAEQARALGCGVVCVDGTLDANALVDLAGIDVVAWWGDADSARAYRRALARRTGPLIALATEADIGPRCLLERHLSVDTTAAGGNAKLLAATG